MDWKTSCHYFINWKGKHVKTNADVNILLNNKKTLKFILRNTSKQYALTTEGSNCEESFYAEHETNSIQIVQNKLLAMKLFGNVFALLPKNYIW